MDPNMNMNQYNQMGVQPQIMNPQEQAQAQVLNYADVNDVAQVESKKSSFKKGAIFFALLGIILIGGGVFYKFTGTEDSTSTNPGSAGKAIDPVETGTTTCTLSDNSGLDAVNRSTVYVLNFDDNNQLQSFNKEYSVTTIKDNVQSEAKLLEEQKKLTAISVALNKNTIDGYNMTVIEPAQNDSPKTLLVKVVIDFSVLDPSQLGGTLMTHNATKVDLTKGQTKDEVKNALSSYGYICQ